MSIYGLADCNNFFVSCERVFRPALEGRPAVVLSSNDGCIVARSDEAKALGVKMAQPAFQAKDLIERHSIAVISGNLPFYTGLASKKWRAPTETGGVRWDEGSGLRRSSSARRCAWL